MTSNYRGTCDFLVLTVSNDEQKKMYSELLCDAETKYKCRVLIVQDGSDGVRVGSAGAVVNAIKAISGICGNGNILRQKIIIINSGGMSKRSVTYALRGKALISVGNDENGVITTLDMIFQSALSMMKNVSAGCAVCCSDILINNSRITFSENENGGVCVLSDVVKGSRHGVMFPDTNGFLNEYLHKKSSEILTDNSLKYGLDGNVLLDTGFVYFRPEFVEKFCSVVDKYFENNIDFEFSLYDDVVPLLSATLDEKDYMSNCKADSKLYRIKSKLLLTLKDESLRVCMVEPPFIHLGTSKEIIENVSEINGKKNIFNSYISEESVVGENSIIDNCVLDGNCVIGSHCILCDIALKNADISDNKCVCGIRLKDGYFVTIVIDINENPKSIIDGSEIWFQKKFCKGFSFTDSLQRFNDNIDGEKISMDDCFNNADYMSFCRFKDYITEKNRCIEQEISIRQYSDSIIADYESSIVRKDKLSFKNSIAVCNLPVRVNFAGTWTDAAPYCLDFGGKVVNCAVKVDGELPICITAEKTDEKVIVLVNSDSGECIRLSDFSELDRIDEYGNFSLHKAALKVFGYHKSTKMICGLKLSIDVKGIMKGSGLGVSSIALSGCFKALAQLSNEDIGDEQIIEMTFVAEQIMGTGGGWQDQAGGLTKGAKLSSSSAGTVQKVDVKPIKINDSFRNDFSKRALLVSTGQRHYGRFIVHEIAYDYYRKPKKMCDTLEKLKALCDLGETAISDLSVQNLSECLNEQQILLKELCKSVTNEKIDFLIDECRKYADGVCICGAGAGGYLLVILKDEIYAETFCKKINMKTHRLEIYYN